MIDLCGTHLGAAGSIIGRRAAVAIILVVGVRRTFVFPSNDGDRYMSQSQSEGEGENEGVQSEGGAQG